MESKERLNRFFKQYNISQTNQEILINYLDSFGVEKDVTNVTIRNHEGVLKVVLRNIDEDLDALTKESIKKYMVSVSKLNRLVDNKPVSKATKKMYRAGFAQFLRWAAKEYNKPEYKEFAESLKVKVKTEGMNPNDLLTKKEIDRMINMAEKGRDQAILAVLAESGCRVGELVSSKIGDVKHAEEFVRLTFRRGKTGLRTVPLKESIIYLNAWLEKHPLKGDPDASLWVSKYPMPLKRGSKEKAHKTLTEDTILRIVHKIADEAGIKKRVHPHLFRHTCATELAKDFTEPMMRTFLGWERNSNMPSIYTHLSGQDIEEAQRKRLGLVKDKEPEPRFQNCPRCKNEMPARTEFCMVCGEPLSRNKAKTVEEGMKAIVSDEIKSIVESMFHENPDKFALIRSKLLPQK